jgi:glycosyltransferase involved in cell wall biosynthesis
VHGGCSVGVVIPAYNEERQIDRVLETMPIYVDHVIVVDDGSTDATLARLREWEGKMGHRLTVIAQPRNQGVGAAVTAGYRSAIESGVDVIGLMAGDGQTDPNDLELIIDPVTSGKADYSKGNRLFTGEAWRKTPHVRYLGNAFLSMLTKIASGYWHVADSQSGFTAISRPAAMALDLNSLWHSYGYPNDLLIQLNIRNFRVADVPTHPRYGVGEKSSMNVFKVMPTVSFLLWKGFLNRLFQKYVVKDFHPLVFFYFFGLAFLIVGVLFGLLQIVLRIVTGGVAITSIVLIAMLIIAGLQFLLFAMWFDMEYNKSLK